MKMHSFKTLAFGISMAILASFTGVFADIDDEDRDFCHIERHCLSQRRIAELSNRLRIDFAIEFGSLNNISTFLGASANPNPNTNPAVAGLIAANLSRITAAGNDVIAVFRELGVHDGALQAITAQGTAFVFASLAYIIDVNLANTGQPSGNQVVDALAIQNSANALGLTFLALTGDPQFTGLLTFIGNLITQEAQAYRRVLEDHNAFGATPSNPASETTAAVGINSLIQDTSAQLALTLVPELADEECSSSESSRFSR